MRGDMQFETGRLAVRPILSPSAQDVAALQGILTPAVLAPLPPAAQDLSAGVAGWVTRQMGLAQVLAVRLRKDGTLIGLAMVMRPAPDAAHLGYLLGQGHWRRGFASELVAALVAHLRADGPVTLRAGVARDNPASARVLEKAGFVADADGPDRDTLHFVLHG